MYNLEILGLKHWMRNLADDQRTYGTYLQCVVSTTEPRDRIFYLDMMASMRRCIAADRRQILSILRDLSLCANCEKTGECTCEPPF